MAVVCRSIRIECHRVHHLHTSPQLRPAFVRPRSPLPWPHVNERHARPAEHVLDRHCCRSAGISRQRPMTGHESAAVPQQQGIWGEFKTGGAASTWQDLISEVLSRPNASNLARAPRRDERFERCVISLSFRLLVHPIPARSGQSDISPASHHAEATAATCQTPAFTAIFRGDLAHPAGTSPLIQCSCT
jgi:hypothetical protein